MGNFVDPFEVNKGNFNVRKKDATENAVQEKSSASICFEDFSQATGTKGLDDDCRCPMCGSKDLDWDTSTVLTSNPPQHRITCKSCKHTFYSGLFSKTYIGDPPRFNQPLQAFPPTCQPSPINYGWICSKCGASLAPFVSECPHCRPGHNTVTCDKISFGPTNLGGINGIEGGLGTTGSIR